MDGTLLDTEKVYFDSLIAALNAFELSSRHGALMPPPTAESRARCAAVAPDLGAVLEILHRRGGLMRPYYDRHFEEPTGRANARPLTGSATKQSMLDSVRSIASLRSQ